MDVPQSVMDYVGDDLQNFLVPILTISEFKSGLTSRPDWKLIGSGTLVTIGDKNYILTAAHVWNATRHAKKIHFSITSRGPSGFAIMRENISPKKLLWDGKSSEWGPDLALLEIAPSDVSEIIARKNFLNLSRQMTTLADHPPKIKGALWAVTGMVEEFSHVKIRESEKTVTANIVSRASFSIIRVAHDRNGYDYLDVGAKLHLPGVPGSFGGVSGGGLWQVNLIMDRSGKISWDGKRHFRGVAFWQTKISDGRWSIRCHGPMSLFHNAWTAWELPKGS